MKQYCANCGREIEDYEMTLTGQCIYCCDNEETSDTYSDEANCPKCDRLLENETPVSDGCMHRTSFNKTDRKINRQNDESVGMLAGFIGAIITLGLAIIIWGFLSLLGF